MTRVRLRNVASINPPSPKFDKLQPDDEVTFLPMESVWPDERVNLSSRRSKASVAVGYTRFENGDVLVPKITPTFEAGRSILATGMHNGAGAGTTELHVVRAGPQIDPQYLLYLTRTHNFLRLGEAEMYGVAGQKRVPDRYLRDLTFELPTILEQQRVTQFLDAEMASIAGLSREISRFVTAIDERKSALLNETMNASCRAVGDPLPPHWSWKPLMRLCDQQRPIMYGIVLPGPHVDDGVPIVKGGDVAANRLDVNSLNRTAKEIEAGYVRSRLRGGDIVIAIRGSVGEVATVPESVTGANLTQDAARISIGDSTDPSWLRLALISPLVASQIQARVTGATIKGINIADLKRIAIPCPPEKEQSDLAQHVGREVVRHETLTQLAKQHRKVVEERRTAIITAAINGHVDPLSNSWVRP